MHVKYSIIGLVALVLCGLVAFSSPALGAGPTPINNDCSAGYVSFTFDDGPSDNTPALLTQLNALNLKATFFVIGQQIQDSWTIGNGNNAQTWTGAQVLQAEIAAGDTIGNHTWDHSSATGQSAGSGPMSDAQFRSELQQTSDAMVAAGVPAPTLYRPPYGDYNGYYDQIAQSMGYQVVMPFGSAYDSAVGDGNIIDTQDWTGNTPAQIADRVINGYTQVSGGKTYHWHGINWPGHSANGAILAFHDGTGPEALNTINSLQTIVNAMNTLHLCSTPTMRTDATGNIVAVPPPNPSGTNLVQNAGLEDHPGNGNAEPTCWQQGGYGNNKKLWNFVAGHNGSATAENLTISNWVDSDGKLVITQRQSQKKCLAVIPVGTGTGATYSMWVYYQGSWAMPFTPLADPNNPATVSIATYYLSAAGVWTYWQGSQAMVPNVSGWSLAYFKTAPLPAGATAISYGLALKGNGSLTTDDYYMSQN